jgi:transcriptional regulator with XRE-family HTH domain
MATAVAKRLDAISEKTGVKEREVAQLLQTTPQTVYRWRNGQVTPQTSHLRRILDLAFAAEELGELYPPDEARLWLFSRNKLLDGRAPVELIAEGRIDPVLQVISQLKDGAFA